MQALSQLAKLSIGTSAQQSCPRYSNTKPKGIHKNYFKASTVTNVPRKAHDSCHRRFRNLCKDCRSRHYGGLESFLGLLSLVAANDGTLTASLSAMNHCIMSKKMTACISHVMTSLCKRWCLLNIIEFFNLFSNLCVASLSAFVANQERNNSSVRSYFSLLRYGFVTHVFGHDLCCYLFARTFCVFVII